MTVTILPVVDDYAAKYNREWECYLGVSSGNESQYKAVVYESARKHYARKENEHSLEPRAANRCFIL
ncbi:hypothetical protein Y032_1080g3563 [Ancylostoma ceylanicum]|uniref:Uncharacterized protein n=1 Tax=Ancylostoma ceylanicum TaxID=53326 RepID=A0A016W6P8_9BILA|nr:hypothetical protein Y032_1080g3563 [Ancylostoma ceylanicum]